MAKIINEVLFKGYQSQFIQGHEISLPELNADQIKDLSGGVNGSTTIHYVNYSLQISKLHKFPFYTATNVDGEMFKKAPRKDYWRKDPRLSKDAQWGNELYTAANSQFDRGHMTKREDVQWGDTVAKALYAADSTFYFPNAVPQHKRLNRVIWRSLEDYILHTESKVNNLKVCVFTGPVLSDENPFFVTRVDNSEIRIPILFWKVVIFQKNDGKLYRVGFMMSQNKLLLEDSIIMDLENNSDLYMKFKDSETYQVKVPLIEELSGITFSSAIDIYNDERSLKLILNEIEIDPDLESDDLDPKDFLGFTIQNIVL
ncbi:endonuclease G [Chryseobacterium sp. 52]|uniref:DNA/RNA non-specific endonuclease n=1 Tax=Chryseobacterium sp. 52 TaxID=2035213 RepID=UPI000C17FED0|nr:DNA/RNA non-specific endonuclease [Chryseobacterium sp. 52]PIF45483.1 endonuclease G [Chryseobacterium sp. 52]